MRFFRWFIVSVLVVGGCVGGDSTPKPTDSSADSGDSSPDSGEPEDSGGDSAGAVIDTTDTTDTAGDSGDSGGDSADSAGDTSAPAEREPTTLELDGADAALFGEAAGDLAGAASAAGDVNGDGYDDVLVGAPGATVAAEEDGAGYVVYGPISGEISLGAADARVQGSMKGSWLGGTVEPYGDRDGDGYDDVLVGQWVFDDDPASYFLYGPLAGDLDVDADATRWGPGCDDESYDACDDETRQPLPQAGVGDLNGDGTPDFAVGTHYWGKNAGAVHVMWELGTHADEVRLDGEADSEFAGYDVAGPGDIDGDGAPDLLVTAALSDRGAPSSGAAYLVHGPIDASGSLADADLIIAGQAEDDAVRFVDGAGDLDGDGYADWIFGSRSSDLGGESSGAAWVELGPGGGSEGAADADAILVGAAAGDAAGAVAGAGDVDGDGHADVLVYGAGASDHGASTGAGWLVRGPVAGTLSLTDADVRLVGGAAGDAAGEDPDDRLLVGGLARGAGDLDADGLDDLLLGAGGNDAAGTDAGVIWIVRGAKL